MMMGRMGMSTSSLHHSSQYDRNANTTSNRTTWPGITGVWTSMHDRPRKRMLRLTGLIRCTPPLEWWNRVSYGWIRSSPLATSSMCTIGMPIHLSVLIILIMACHAPLAEKLTVQGSLYIVLTPAGSRVNRLITLIRYLQGKTVLLAYLSIGSCRSGPCFHSIGRLQHKTGPLEDLKKNQKK